MCVHPNELRKKPLIDELDENSPKDNTLQAAILAAMKLGSSEWVKSIIEDEKLAEDLVPPTAKVDTFGEFHPCNDEISGWLQETSWLHTQKRRSRNTLTSLSCSQHCTTKS